MPGIRFAHLFGLSDALSSSFRDDGKVDAATRGMTLRPDLNGTTPKTALLPENVHFEGPFNASSSSGWDLVTIYGIRSHCGYWGAGKSVEVNCFDSIAARLYK